jgi:hypothetical protein
MFVTYNHTVTQRYTFTVVFFVRGIRSAEEMSHTFWSKSEKKKKKKKRRPLERLRHILFICWFIGSFTCGIFNDAVSKIAGPGGRAVCGGLVAGIAGSNPAEDMNVSLVFICCVVLYR